MLFLRLTDSGCTKIRQNDSMTRSKAALIGIHRQELEALWGENEGILPSLQATILEDRDAIVDRFYQRLMAFPQVTEYLDSDLVNRRLRKGVGSWLGETFSASAPEDPDRFLEYQLWLGRMHADIDIPLNLFLLGLRVLKGEIHEALEKTLDDRERAAMSLLTDRLLDLVLVAAAESYSDESGELMRDLQRMRMSVPTENLQLVCEQMRGRLMAWFARLLTRLHQEDLDRHHILTLEEAEIGLWLEHKAPLLFPENNTLDKLLQLCREIDGLVAAARAQHTRDEESEMADTVTALEEKVREADWLLSELAREIGDMEGRTDPLTRLFNRRHLATVLHFESHHALRSGQQYAVLMLDIDHFKQINDQHGHGAGDQVLKHLSATMTETVRSGDFVFRYGGEEFLILLPAVTEEAAKKVAEKIRRRIEESSLELPGGESLTVTVSIGIALSAGERNYERTIARADQALYRAKEQGRNRFVMAAPPD
ncbi:MAG: GGDEF domain-containing protein [Gammaproteobacteria bacterium]|nr:MAG: GGDEF domain-containing protein [Gammaproteobacteria bacterium]